LICQLLGLFTITAAARLFTQNEQSSVKLLPANSTPVHQHQRHSFKDRHPWRFSFPSSSSVRVRMAYPTHAFSSLWCIIYHCIMTRTSKYK
jgi:hypothetical protein